MGKAVSVDLRERVVRMVKEGAARHFGVGVSSAVRWVERARVRGDLTPDKRGGNHRSHRIDADRDLIMDWVAAELDLTLAKIGERLKAERGYYTFPSVVHRFFQRHGVTRKKRLRTRSNKAARI